MIRRALVLLVTIALALALGRQWTEVARIDGEPAHGAFFSIEALPEPFHGQHREIILMAIRKAEELGW